MIAHTHTLRLTLTQQRTTIARRRQLCVCFATTLASSRANARLFIGVPPQWQRQQTLQRRRNHGSHTHMYEGSTSAVCSKSASFLLLWQPQTQQQYARARANEFASGQSGTRAHAAAAATAAAARRRSARQQNDQRRQVNYCYTQRKLTIIFFNVRARASALKTCVCVCARRRYGLDPVRLLGLCRFAAAAADDNSYDVGASCCHRCCADSSSNSPVRPTNRLAECTGGCYGERVRAISARQCVAAGSSGSGGGSSGAPHSSGQVNSLKRVSSFLGRGHRARARAPEAGWLDACMPGRTRANVVDFCAASARQSRGRIVAPTSGRRAARAKPAGISIMRHAMTAGHCCARARARNKMLVIERTYLFVAVALN